MGRGIDFKGVNVVINYDFPPTAVSYIHRIGKKYTCVCIVYMYRWHDTSTIYVCTLNSGRTGRAGRAGRAITFFTEDDAINLRRLVLHTHTHSLLFYPYQVLEGRFLTFIM